MVSIWWESVPTGLIYVCTFYFFFIDIVFLKLPFCFQANLRNDTAGLVCCLTVWLATTTPSSSCTLCVLIFTDNVINSATPISNSASILSFCSQSMQYQTFVWIQYEMLPATTTRHCTSSQKVEIQNWYIHLKTMWISGASRTCVSEW